MRVIKDNQIIEDGWQRLETVEEDQPLPEGDIIIPFRYWIEHHNELPEREGQLAVCIDGEDETEEVARYLDHFPLIALDFPAFKDGRCYTHAHLLRERYHYEGELRAVGDVLRDQLFFMKRCGIDSFALRSDKEMEDALAAFNDFSVTYQTAADGAPPIYDVRSKA
ncbi:MAG: DUF934 domain-containing protein [Gammaproteobacteria bacterium]